MKCLPVKHVKFPPGLKWLLVFHFKVTSKTLPKSGFAFRTPMYLAHTTSFRKLTRQVLMQGVTVIQLGLGPLRPPNSCCSSHHAQQKMMHFARTKWCYRLGSTARQKPEPSNFLLSQLSLPSSNPLRNMARSLLYGSLAILL